MVPDEGEAMERTIRISEVVIGKRHRQDMGDIKALADSIETQGLLQPIGITEANELVFGARRIEAFKMLGRDEIPARVVDVTSLVEGEHDENEVRKEFTTTERVAIAATIEDVIGTRQGQRTDLKHEQLPVPVPEVIKGAETRDVAAKKAGLGSGKTYQQARTVVERGTPELQEAMDRGDVSVKDAEAFSRLPPEEQKEALKLPKPERVKKAQSLRGQRSVNQQPKKDGVQREPHRGIDEEDLPEPTTRTGNVSEYTEAHRWAGIAISELRRVEVWDPYATEALMSVKVFVEKRLEEIKDYERKNSRDKRLRVVQVGRPE